MLGGSATGDENQIEGAGGGERGHEVTPRGIHEWGGRNLSVDITFLPGKNSVWWWLAIFFPIAPKKTKVANPRAQDTGSVSNTTERVGLIGYIVLLITPFYANLPINLEAWSVQELIKLTINTIFSPPCSLFPSAHHKIIVVIVLLLKLWPQLKYFTLRRKICSSVTQCNGAPDGWGFRETSVLSTSSW